MKKRIGNILSWTCYYIGDMLSRIPTNWAANGYQWWMNKSCKAQDWGDKGPWENIK